jgi:hypothetical protein
MDLQHVNAKIFFDGPLTVDGARLIGMCHDWVREQVFEEVLVDVADYRHVPDGPALMVVGHEADYVIDHSDGRPGLRYNRKAALAGDNVDRWRQAIVAACRAARLLKGAIGDDAPAFSQTELELSVNDRAIAPNTAETFAACKSDIETCLATIAGHNAFTLRHNDDPRRLFSVTVSLSKPLEIAALD